MKQITSEDGFAIEAWAKEKGFWSLIKPLQRALIVYIYNNPTPYFSKALLEKLEAELEDLGYKTDNKSTHKGWLLMVYGKD